MPYIINKKLTGIICIIPIVYFTGISLYSLVPELIEINKLTKLLFYWINNTVFISSIVFVFSKYVFDKRIKLLLKGTSFFLLTLGIFQIIKTLGISVDKIVWIMYCPIYIIFLLISFRYGRKLYEK